jgi:hypothetical protein
MSKETIKNSNAFVDKRAKEIAKAIKERNEARKCLREAITSMSFGGGKYTVYSVAEMEVWRKVAGMKKAK